MSISYAKPALNLEQQADLLLNRGLKDISKEALITKLSSVNYYRIRGYTYAYQDNTVDDTPFLKNNCWNYIWNDYVMDSRLRSLIFESISHIEIALRTQIELVMSLSYGSNWYTDSRYFFNSDFFNKNFEELEKCWERSEEEFKKHYETKYIETELPPSWMIFETSTFGLTSKYYESIDNNYSEKVQNVPNDPNVPNSSLTARQNNILEQIKINNSVTSKELAEKLDVSEKTIKRDIADLKQKGILTSSGKTNSGIWIIKDAGV